ncbi:MAG: hypothetical protein LQ339_005767 [Xanthoria mediterranea]|nr:MAG: hypothetical protein LQ339_005767 [Xanthoria mediterranea]
MIPDAFGWETPNSRLLCDTYAERAGVLVYLPEFQAGHHLPMSLMEDIGTMTSGGDSLLKKIPSTLRVVYNMAPYLYLTRPSVTTPGIQSFFTSLRSSSSSVSNLPVFAVGFCWGGLYAITLTHSTSITPEGKPLVDAAFAAHPSNLTLPGDIEKVERPLSVCQGTQDFVMDMKGVKQIQQVLERKNKAGGGDGTAKGRHEIQIVEGAKHGFAVRGNPENEVEMAQAQRAEDQAVAWFERWIAESGEGEGAKAS